MFLENDFSSYLYNYFSQKASDSTWHLQDVDNFSSGIPLEEIPLFLPLALGVLSSENGHHTRLLKQVPWTKWFKQHKFIHDFKGQKSQSKALAGPASSLCFLLGSPPPGDTILSRLWFPLMTSFSFSHLLKILPQLALSGDAGWSGLW